MYSSYPLLLISSLIPKCSYSWFLLNGLKCGLWPPYWSFLVNIPWELEQIVYSALLGWNVLYMSIRSSWLMMLFSSTKSLWIFCLLHVSITEKGMDVSKFLGGFVLFFSCRSQFFSHTFWFSLFLGAYILRTDVASSWRTDPFLYPCNFSCYELYFVWN